MSCCIYWIWTVHGIFIMAVQPVTSIVTWEVETRIIRIGETVVLTCTVHEVEAIDTGETRQWYTGSSLVCFNGKPTNPLKYKEALYKNKFKLLIYNVTEADLNRDYQCLYSFDVYSKTLNITEENFEYPPTENTTELGYNYTTDGNLNVKLHMEKVFPVPNCTIEFEEFELMFEEIMYTTNGLYYDVYLFHQSHIVVHESTQFNVTCLLLQPYLIATHIIKIDKGIIDQEIDQDKPSIDLLSILLSVFGSLVLVIIVIVIIRLRCIVRQTNIRSSEANMEYEPKPLAILSVSSNDEDSHSEEETSLNTISILKLAKQKPLEEIHLNDLVAKIEGLDC